MRSWNCKELLSVHQLNALKFVMSRGPCGDLPVAEEQHDGTHTAGTAVVHSNPKLYNSLVLHDFSWDNEVQNLV